LSKLSIFIISNFLKDLLELIITPFLCNFIASYRSSIFLFAINIVGGVACKDIYKNRNKDIFGLFFYPAGRPRRRGCGACRDGLITMSVSCSVLFLFFG
jgi:hypothetical protein